MSDSLTPHKITRDEFIKGYLLSYFGQWAANVANAGNPGWQKQIIRPPVEDIVYQAEKTWDICCETSPMLFGTMPGVDEKLPYVYKY